MATTSKLRAQKTTSAQANAGQPYGDIESAVEVLYNALTAGVVVVNPDNGKLYVSGNVADNSPADSYPLIGGGVAVTSSSYAPAYTVGDVAQLAVDKDSGGLLVSDRIKTRAVDSISADPKQYSTASTATPATADVTVFTLAAGEKGVIQNLSADAPLAYKYGASASTSSFSGVLNCGSVADDGKGGHVVIDDFIGVVSVAKISGTARYIAYKLS